MAYDELKMKRFLSNGDVPGFLSYLRTLPEETELLGRYERLFVNNPPEFDFPTNQPFLKSVLSVYYRYYVYVFGQSHTPIEGKKYLHERMHSTLKLPFFFSVDVMERIIGYRIKRLGYHFLGGTTSAYYGPYIWKTTEKTIYEVEIPFGIINVSVFFMNDFLSNSWLSFLSLNATGTAGWTKREGLYCRWDSYQGKFSSDAFQISFLKHEAQHLYDFRTYKRRLNSTQLEYRAKLCELSYYPTSDLLERFLNSAKDDPNFAHSQAEYWLISDLSERLFHQPYLTDRNEWRKHYSFVAEQCRCLLTENYRI